MNGFLSMMDELMLYSDDVLIPYILLFNKKIFFIVSIALYPNYIY